MKLIWTCNVLIQISLLAIGYSGNLIALENEDDLSLSVEFLEYLIDMECDPDSDCIELPSIQDQVNYPRDARHLTEIDAWANDEGQDEN